MEETWTQQRLEAMIVNKAEESIHLDFKAAGALGKEDGKRKEICKDVSAFANSDGGVLIYGLNEADHKADSFDFVDGDIFTKEWLEQTINDGIQRRIEGIHIHPVRFDDDIKKTVYVVEVPVSFAAPHMSKDNRFYKRYNFMSVLMEEYEVRHSYDRKKRAKLKIGDVLISIPNRDTWAREEEIEFKLSFHVTNESHNVGNDYKLRCRIANRRGCGISHARGDEINLVELPDGSTIIAAAKAIPIYPDDIVKTLEFTLHIAIEKIYDIILTFPMQAVLFTDGETVTNDYDFGQNFVNMYESLIGIGNGSSVSHE